jgi:hypothetical protein
VASAKCRTRWSSTWPATRVLAMATGAQLDPGYRVRKGKSTIQKGRRHMNGSERWLPGRSGGYLGEGPAGGDGRA